MELPALSQIRLVLNIDSTFRTLSQASSYSTLVSNYLVPIMCDLGLHARQSSCYICLTARLDGTLYLYCIFIHLGRGAK